jgi:hypothetical protein
MFLSLRSHLKKTDGFERCTSLGVIIARHFKGDTRSSEDILIFHNHVEAVESIWRQTILMLSKVIESDPSGVLTIRRSPRGFQHSAEDFASKFEKIWARYDCLVIVCISRSRVRETNVVYFSFAINHFSFERNPSH